ncbi:phage baseplate assembly protein V [Burkholderia sp. lig30]|jgi:phage baseplate assembly protein V|uniref:phage baseplate assembly protein V n=1 Tax=Burkholderia sp. lig30 TaxID=1192124 RepID=UPI000460F599|nr:phage baseplate assembly protein V [Burkholderia sp. lig30]KDB09520.1 phage baseplate assembly protein V [Burkholderia sp. lig30]
MIGDIDKRIQRALAGVRQAFRGVVNSVSSDGPVQIVGGEGLSGEAMTDLEYMQHYGFSSNPPDGTMAVILPIGGKTGHGIIIATEHGAYRFKQLMRGEVAISSDEGDSVVLNRGRVINVKTKTLNIDADDEVNINTKKMAIKADSIDADTPELAVSGLTSANGGLAAKAGEGREHAIDIDGTANVTDDVFINGKSQSGHRHKDSLGGMTTAEQ